MGKKWISDLVRFEEIELDENSIWWLDVYNVGLVALVCSRFPTGDGFDSYDLLQELHARDISHVGHMLYKEGDLRI